MHLGLVHSHQIPHDERAVQCNVSAVISTEQILGHGIDVSNVQPNAVLLVRLSLGECSIRASSDCGCLPVQIDCATLAFTRSICIQLTKSSVNTERNTIFGKG